MIQTPHILNSIYPFGYFQSIKDPRYLPRYTSLLSRNRVKIHITKSCNFITTNINIKLINFISLLLFLLGRKIRKLSYIHFHKVPNKLPIKLMTELLKSFNIPISSPVFILFLRFNAIVSCPYMCYYVWFTYIIQSKQVKQKPLCFTKLTLTYAFFEILKFIKQSEFDFY